MDRRRYGNKPAPHKPEGGWGRTDTQSWSQVGLPYFDPFPTGCHAPNGLPPQNSGAKPQGLCMCATNQTGDDSIVANALKWLRASPGQRVNCPSEIYVVLCVLLMRTLPGAGTFEVNGTQPFFLAVPFSAFSSSDSP